MSSSGEGDELPDLPVPEDCKYVYYVVLFQNPEDKNWDLFAVIRGYPGLKEPYAIAVHLARVVEDALKEVDEELDVELQIIPVGGEKGIPEEKTAKLLEAVDGLLETAAQCARGPERVDDEF
ncbi:hypothetical protein [Methanopyrus sp. KOL6]|uniref:hypothetical protein n=1 Tax=Methanopyrus sp. KOL6 TaxID=1937004 RepID=UPI000B4A8EC6|nr:hypothetical protein [Methanopyrus sp. KOL6]